VPTITIPIEDLVFVVCTLIGGGLLLITVVLDDILGSLLDAIGFDVDFGGVSLVPLLLGFVSMFGVGGLFATQVLDIHGGPAAVAGAIGGAGGFALVFFMFSFLRKSEGTRPFQLADLVGGAGSVSVAIPAGRLGSVYVKAEGQTHEYSATASVEIPAGTPVTVTAVAGNALVVAPLMPAAAAAPTATSSGPSDDGRPVDHGGTSGA
jgi:membrane protein implicated in regulation of membrane protease activity